MASRPRAQPRAGWAVTSIQTVTDQQHHGPEAEESDDDVEVLAGAHRTTLAPAGPPASAPSVMRLPSLDRTRRQAGHDLALEDQHQDDQAEW